MKVNIQKKVEGEWRGVLATLTNPEGKYNETLSNNPGKYRAVAPVTTVGSDVCARAVSDVVRYTIYV
jgi:hypothetical protein